MSKSKKKAVAKMKAEKIVKPYAVLTQEQYDELRDIINWDNPMDVLKGISNLGNNVELLEIGFNIGEVHSLFQKTIERIENILNKIEPEDWTDDSEEEGNEFEWDSENEN